MTNAYRCLPLLGLLLGACTAPPTQPTDSSAAGPTVPPVAARVADESDLAFLQPAADAPPLAATQVSFWAVKGQDRRVSLYYHARPGATDSSELVRFRVDKRSLRRRPDGRSFATGDSILITITIVDAQRLIVDFQPSGLTFDQKYPARLWFKWTETEDDLNGDHVVDTADDAIRLTSAIWGQETVGGPWTVLATEFDLASQEVEAKPTSFTRYAVAY